VLGDLDEKRASFGVALQVAFCVIFSRIRRTSDPVVRLMEALALYTSVLLVAMWIDRGLLWHPATLATPAAAMLAALIVFDAYSNPEWKWNPMIGVVLSAVAGISAGAFALPRWVLILGVGWAGMSVLPVRWAFPPISGKPASGPAYWQKLEMPPLGDFVKYVTAAVIGLLLIGAMWVGLSFR
jgi:hypothetical protein